MGFRIKMAKKWLTIAQGMDNYTQASSDFYNMIWAIIAKNMQSKHDRIGMFRDFVFRRNSVKDNYGQLSVYDQGMKR